MRKTSVMPAGAVVRMLTVLAAAAIAATLILVSMAPTIHPNDVLRYFVNALVYSSFIAFPSWFLLYRCKSTGKLTLLVSALVLLLTNVAGCLAGGLLLMLTHIQPTGHYWESFYHTIGFCTVITLTFGLGVALYEELRGRFESAQLELRTRQMEQERAEKLIAEARLSSLESRIHPHFLFNTLNSIAALIPKDPEHAERMVYKLASLLRFSLNANQTGLVPLGQELKIVRDYLEIEQPRFGERLRYSIDVPEALHSVGVPPLSLQSLVENSVKHAVAPRPEGGEIRIAASAVADRVDLEVSDDGPGFELERVPTGHGLDNLSSRLALLFGPAAWLDVVRKGTRSTVRVSVPRSQPRAKTL